MDDDQPEGMRERTRRIVQSELTGVAQDLFVEHGYEATTVDQIVAAAGMSKRTFFRYFSSKDDVVLGKYDLFGDKMAEELAARPADEPIWASLRRVFDIAVSHVEDPAERTRNEAMERIVHSTPALNAGYLDRISRMQKLLVDGVTARLDPSPEDGAGPAHVRAAAIVGAAFACLVAAQAAWFATEQRRPFADLLDESMAAVTTT